MFPSKVRFFILSTTTNFTFSNKNMTEQLFMNTLTKISEKAKVIKKESSGYARTLRLINPAKASVAPKSSGVTEIIIALLAFLLLRPE